MRLRCSFSDGERDAFSAHLRSCSTRNGCSADVAITDTFCAVRSFGFFVNKRISIERFQRPRGSYGGAATDALESQNPLPICLNPQAAGTCARIF